MGSYAIATLLLFGSCLDFGFVLLLQSLSTNCSSTGIQLGLENVASQPLFKCTVIKQADVEEERKPYRMEEADMAKPLGRRSSSSLV